MAITATHWGILKELRQRGELPQRGSILEIGQANIYGDFDPREIGEGLSGKLLERLRAAIESQDAYDLARLIYLNVFDSADVVSIDAGGPTALKLDLNKPIQLSQKFDVCINHGTAEHIFDIGNVFRTMHQNTRVGGLMIHEAPFTGWVDHGFYCLQPTLFWDVAAANEYEIRFSAAEHLASRSWGEIKSREHVLELKRCDRLADNLMLFIAMRKAVDAPFVVPSQGVYAGAVSDEVGLAWRALR